MPHLYNGTDCISEIVCAEFQDHDRMVIPAFLELPIGTTELSDTFDALSSSSPLLELNLAANTAPNSSLFGPRSYNWKDVAFCDEFHLRIGPQVTKYVKRRRGTESREKACNIHKKKVTSKDTKAKAREEGHLLLLNVFVIIGHNYKRMIPYEVPSNSIGKMTTKVYTQEILPAIKDDLLSRGLTLWQDKDSAYDSNGTKAWFKKNNIPYITSPGNSPDLSIFESYAHPLKKLFHAKRSRTKKEALARFSHIFEEEFDQEIIQNM